MKPNTLLPLDGEGGQHLSYDLPHRIHTARAYPLTTSNGSTIIVYGHQNGIRVIWRSQPEDEQEETEPFCAPVIHTVDISLGGPEALTVAFPHLPADVLHDTKSIPKLLSEKMVVAIACSDCSIRVVSLPLTPPNREDIAEQTLVLSGSPGHQSLPNCVSVTFTPRQSAIDDEVQIDDADDITKPITSRPASRSNRHSSAQVEVNWDLLIASHSPDLAGRLIIHRIPCNKSNLDESGEAIIPWSVHLLASAAISISFNSALYPSPYHSRLLVAEAQGVVKIMECVPQVNSGPWLASLYTDFEIPSNIALPKRKTILDVGWLLGGRAIVVLMANGEWGVWDIDGAVTQPAEAAPQSYKFISSSRFAIDGRVLAKVMTSLDFKATTSRLAPMTPSTRKQRQTALFAPDPQQHRIPLHGGISIIPAPSALSSRADDNSVLLWHGTNIITIPSFFSHWQNKARSSGNLFGAGAKGEIKAISNVQFGNEACNEVSLSPSSTQLEILVASDRRLTIIASKDAQKRRTSVSFHTWPVSPSNDEQLLAAGDLDVSGMDRMLDGMSNGHSPEAITVARHIKMITK